MVSLIGMNLVTRHLADSKRAAGGLMGEHKSHVQLDFANALRGSNIRIRVMPAPPNE
jgi:hypothetical protein